MSKGSGRRPASVTEAEIAARWAETFKPNAETIAAMEEARRGDLPVYSEGFLQMMADLYSPDESDSVIKSDTPDSEK